MSNTRTSVINGVYTWPTTYIGSEEYYSFDLSVYLKAENDTLVGYTLEPLTGITLLDEVTIGEEIFLKFRADSVGTHKVIINIDSIEGGRTQKLRFLANLVVTSL